jgi:Leucine-rich repeat (LRR) protein
MSDSRVKLIDELSYDQRQWADRYKRHFKDKTPEYVERLRKNGSYSSQDWKSNYKHTALLLLYKDYKAYGQVFDRIGRARANNEEKLCFSDLLLTRLPSNISSVRSLKRFSLYELDIHTIPKELFELVNLQELIISKCPVIELPKEVNNLKNLVTLDMTRCRLREIPELNHLVLLRSLLLGYNYITSLPESTLELPSLQRLDLQASDVNLQWSDESLPSLLMIDISQTNTRKIPKKIAERLASLIWWDVGGLDLDVKFGEDLLHLNLSNNNIAAFDIEVISSCKRLSYLNLSNNKIDSLSSEQRKRFRKIKKVLLQGNKANSDF